MVTPLRADAIRAGLTPAPRPRASARVDDFMVALRNQESSDNYEQIGPTHPEYGRMLGAYQISEANWGNWSRAAGIPGANWRDPAAQDRVARHQLRYYFDKYGDWGLVAAAWFGGEGAANAMQAGVDLSGIDDGLISVPEYVDRLLSKVQMTSPAAAAISPSNMNAARMVQLSGGNHTRVDDFHGTPDVSGAVFPVPGGTYSDDWHAPRSGGRQHKGTDIFAEKGTPALSMVGGEVVKAEYADEGLGGRRVWVRGNDGNYYYYAHLDSVKVSAGQKVAPGEVLGTVGTSGNAKGTPPHLHFGISKGMGGQGWFNPQAVLNSMKNRGGEVAYHENGLPMEEEPALTQASFNSSDLLVNVFDQVANFVAGGQREPLSDTVPFFDEEELV